MTHILIFTATILILSVVVAIAARHDVSSRRRALERRRARNIADNFRSATPYTHPRHDSHACHESHSPESPGSHESAEAGTRRLIGNEAYGAMTARIADIISNHRCDSTRTVALTGGPESEEGAARLHDLLPGDSLHLRDSSAPGVARVNVYSDDILIGHLLLEDAERALSVMHSMLVTGVYVAEQNCYGDVDAVALNVIIFYAVPVLDGNEVAPASDTPYKLIFNGDRPIVVYQN